MKAMSLRIRMQTLSPCPTPSPLEAAGDAGGAVPDFGVAAPPLAADDAEEKLLRSSLSFSDLSPGLDPHGEEREARLEP